MNCPHCKQNNDNVTSVHALGDIWEHRHGDCVFWSMSRDPFASVRRYATKKAAWEKHREEYDSADKWAQGWDAHFSGNERRAVKLWKQYERENAPEPTSAA